MEIGGLGVEVKVKKRRIEEICQHNGVKNMTSASDYEQRLKLWKGSKVGFAAMGHLSPD